MKHSAKNILAALVVILAPAAALADEYVKVEGAVRENIPAAPFLAGAYGFIWVAVVIYVVSIARGMGRVKSEIEDLRRKVETK